MTIDVPLLKLRVWARFMGHPELSENHAGIETFFHPSTVADLRCWPKANTPSDCKVPTVIVANSGLHDAADAHTGSAARGMEEFAHYIDDLMCKLRLAKAAGCRVSWRGITHLVASSAISNLSDPTIRRRHANLHALDVMAMKAAARSGVDAFSVADIMSDTSIDHAGRTSDDIHVGAIAKYGMGPEADMLLSSMLTQRTLQHMCMSAHDP
jgi:hypothetical protein